jgi:hypothetical protein
LPLIRQEHEAGWVEQPWGQAQASAPFAVGLRFALDTSNGVAEALTVGSGALVLLGARVADAEGTAVALGGAVADAVSAGWVALAVGAARVAVAARVATLTVGVGDTTAPQAAS